MFDAHSYRLAFRAKSSARLVAAGARYPSGQSAVADAEYRNSARRSIGLTECAHIAIYEGGQRVGVVAIADGTWS